MASHQTPLFLAEQFQHVRLVEVSDEILNLITQGEQLLFKSSSSLPGSTDINDKAGHLHLCSNNRSWLVKQVSTSNSLYITQAQLQPQPENNGHVDSAMTDALDCNTQHEPLKPACRLTAISKPTNVLELHPISPAAQQAVVDEHLDRLVPHLNSVKDLDGSGPISSRYSCSDLLKHIPAPSATVTKAFAQHCIGNHWNDKAYRPTPTLLLETWRFFITAAISHSVDINEILLDNGNTSLNNDLLNNDMYDMESEVFISIAATWRLPDGIFAENGLSTSSGKKDTGSLRQRFNPQETARWVGNLILRVARDENVELSRASFEAQWEDAVPANWVKFCSVEVLLPACVVEQTQSDSAQDSDVVRWRPFQNSSGDVATQNGEEKAKDVTSASVTAKSGGGKNKRKWHEKFAAQRDAKK